MTAPKGQSDASWSGVPADGTRRGSRRGPRLRRSAWRSWASRTSSLYDHVVGADPAVHNGWNGPYDVHTTFHEPFVMFGYLAAVTQRLELVTGVIILPQRQTALVAKQAAEVDLLSERPTAPGNRGGLERRRIRGTR